ncbi:cation:proton antiporter [Stygiolobus caldivivus]|uniref:Sodium:proton antiporter n=1 Tax=Stygiolobus caldivivus TaxID=2824673 RepID=A0A8D5U5P0_9CREN|nr:cation:proton antiporter [Stygiolobus caldivivus]BCU69354.1 sodium:proton antiporter [Stygiolobus caldivivus]
MNAALISLLFLGIMLLGAKLMEELFGRLSLVKFVGPILIGIILGPGVLGVIKLNDIISFIASLGIVFLLFLAGVEEIGEKFSVDKKDLLASILELIIPIVAVGLTLYYVGEFNLVIIIPLAMTSVGPLTRLLSDIGIAKERLGIKIFNQSVLNEIISIFTFSIITHFSVIQFIGTLLLVILITVSGKYIAKILEAIEGYFKVREIEFATTISIILIVGFLAEIYGFNSAIAALFLGFLLRDYFSDRPHLKERLHAFTYGFFEPLFFVSIGLYFVKISIDLLLLSAILFSATVLSKFASGFLVAKTQDIDEILNGLGTSVKGGVDVSLLITALASSIITPFQYSFSTLAITYTALFFPLMFRLRYGKPRGEKKKVNLTMPIKNVIEEKVFVTCEDNLRRVVDLMNEKKVRAFVVINDQSRPTSMITMTTLLEIDPNDYEELKVCDVGLEDVEIVDENTRVIDVLRKFRETETSVIAVVDKEGKLSGVVYERELLRKITE